MYSCSLCQIVRLDVQVTRRIDTSEIGIDCQKRPNINYFRVGPQSSLIGTLVDVGEFNNCLEFVWKTHEVLFWMHDCRDTMSSASSARASIWHAENARLEAAPNWSNVEPFLISQLLPCLDRRKNHPPSSKNLIQVAARIVQFVEEEPIERQIAAVVCAFPWGICQFGYISVEFISSTVLWPGSGFVPPYIFRTTWFPDEP